MTNDTDTDRLDEGTLQDTGLPYLVVVRTEETNVDVFGPINATGTQEAISRTLGTHMIGSLEGYYIDVYPVGITTDGKIERETYDGGDIDGG